MMGVIYQLTFFLALGLLAIVITIFVFAVSLLGRAMEAAAKSEREKLVERKENNAKEMAGIKKEIEESEASGQIPRGLTRELRKLEKRDKNFEKETSKIRRAPELLTVKGGVVPAGAFLIGALILSGGAWGLSEMQNFVPITLWILGLAAVGYSIFRIYKSLRVIESVAITSEEEAERRLAEAVMVAMQAVEEERKPVVVLEIPDEKLPVHVNRNCEKEVDVLLRLMWGDEARDTLLYFAAPPGFGFPDLETDTQSARHPTIPNYVTTVIPAGNIKRGISQPIGFTGSLRLTLTEISI